MYLKKTDIYGFLNIYSFIARLSVSTFRKTVKLLRKQTFMDFKTFHFLLPYVISNSIEDL